LTVEDLGVSAAGVVEPLSRQRHWRFLLVVGIALMFPACSASPPEQPDPSPPTQASTAPVNYPPLGESIEQAIGSGSVALDTIEAVLISADGQTVLTHYRNGRKPDKPMHVYSVTKSVLSALIGIALDEKLIKDLDSPLGELLPRHRAQMTDDIARVTLRHLMTMSAGFEYDEPPSDLFRDVLEHDGDAVAFILKRGLVGPPGETFAYSNSSAHLVSGVLAEALRRSDGSNPRTVLDYATEKLFKPLGIDTRNAYTARVRPDDPTPFEKAGFGWATDARGINIGAGGLRLRPADMLKFGQLYLDHGKWRGQQVIPEEWVAASAAPSPASSQYGLMWWLDKTPSGDPAYTAAGFGGQLIVVVPKHRLAVTVASQPTNDYATDSEDVLALVSDVILTKFH
jgi:CubicO group peptidase (beta-lactamase class C family)